MNAPAQRQARIPVHTITGFLGSGKTTLLQRLLSQPEFADTGVLINEFGEIALDHEIVQSIDSNTVVLKNGCICCGVRDDLASSLRELLGRRARGTLLPFKRVVIETTGLAEPAPILATLSFEPVLCHQVQPARVITVVDSLNAPLHQRTRPEWARQVVAADTIVLTKSDLANSEAVDSLHRRLAGLNPTATVVDANAHELSSRLFEMGTEPTGAAAWRSQPIGDGEPNREGGWTPDCADDVHSHNVKALSLRISEPLDWVAFGVWLSMLVHAHGDKLLRVKGLLRFKGVDGRILLNGVQHVIHQPTHVSSADDSEAQTDEQHSILVIICQDLPLEQLRASFEALVGGRLA